MRLLRIVLFLILLIPFSASAVSRKKLDSMLRVLPSQKDTSRLSTLLRISKLYRDINDDSALYYARLVEKEAIAAGNQERECDAYIVIGNCFAHKEEKDSAFAYKWKAVRTGTTIGYNKGVANGYSDIGLYHKEAGDLDSALKYTLIAAQMKEQLSDRNSLGITYTNLGLIYASLGEYTSSNSYYNKAIDIFYSLKSWKNYTQVLNNIAAYYDDMKQYDTAITIYQRSYHIRDSIGDIEGKSQSMLNIGVAYRNLGDLKSSEKYLTDALAIKQKIGDRKFIGACLLDLAFTYRLEGKFPLAKSLLAKVDSFAAITPSKELKRDLYLEYSRFFSDQKNFEKALDYMTLYQTMKDSILDDEKTKSIADMSAKYKTAEKERDNLRLQKESNDKELALEKEHSKNIWLFSGIGILALILIFAIYAYASKRKSGRLLEEKNSQITRQNSTLKELNKKLIDSEEELTELNTQKDKLFSIISHDLSNPVKAISNYNQAVISQKDNMSKEQLADSFTKLNRSLEPLQGFLDNLLQWSLMQRQGVNVKLSEVDINMIVNENINLYKAYSDLKNVTVKSSVSNLVLNTDADMLRLIIRNILNNAIKFSPENEVVHISAESANGFYNISIIDKGKGISAENIVRIEKSQPLNSEKGTAGESGTGLGLNLVKEYVTRLGGKLKIDSTTSGTIVTIQLPTA